MAIKINSYYDSAGKKVKQVTDLANTQKTQINSNYDNSLKILQDTATKNINSAENSYDSAYGDNAVAEAINSRQISHNMAMSGLSDSGLNRTQQTAVSLQKSNADQNVTAQKNAFIGSIESQLQSDTANIEQNRTNALNDIDNNLTSQINDINNTASEEEKAKIEEITTTLASITDPTQAAAYIKSMSEQYNINAKALCSYSPVVSATSYNKWLDNSKYYSNGNVYKTALNTLSTYDTTNAAGKTQAAQFISGVVSQVPYLSTKQIKKLCSSAGISYDSYLEYKKNKNYYTNGGTYKEAITTLSSYDTTSYAGKSQAAQFISGLTKKISYLTKTQVKKLCESAGISYSEYNKYLKDKNYFTNLEKKEQAAAEARATANQIAIDKAKTANKIAIAKAKAASSSKETSSDYDLGVVSEDEFKSDKKLSKKYSTYEDYVNKKIQQAYNNGNINNSQAKALIKKYNLD